MDRAITPNDPPPSGEPNRPIAGSRNGIEIGVFGKHWTPGATKTRLAAGVGHEHAAAASHLFLETTLDRLTSLPIAKRCRLEYAPPECGDAFAALPQVAAGGWHLEPQAQGDLGTRMQTFFQRALTTARAAVLVGSDSPHLPLEEVQKACEWLADDSPSPRCVFGPTEDGGYWLIGASLAPPPVFADMPWSKSDLLESTLTRLEQAGWQEEADYCLLRSWYDVDEPGDLTRLRQSLTNTTDSALKRLATRLDELLGPAFR